VLGFIEARVKGSVCDKLVKSLVFQFIIVPATVKIPFYQLVIDSSLRGINGFLDVLRVLQFVETLIQITN